MTAHKPPQNSTPLPPPERDDVHVAANRCPFCHDSVALDADEWVSCWSCQARHHAPCWHESGLCGSCGEARFLKAAGDTSQKTTEESNRPNTQPSVPGERASKRLTYGLGALAVLAVAITLIDLGPDQGVGWAIAAGAGLACLASSVRTHYLFVCAALSSVLGAGLIVSHNTAAHVRHFHPEVKWIGVAFLVLGLALGALRHVTSRKR